MCSSSIPSTSMGALTSVASYTLLQEKELIKDGIQTLKDAKMAVPMLATKPSSNFKAWINVKLNEMINCSK